MNRIQLIGSASLIVLGQLLAGCSSEVGGGDAGDGGSGGDDGTGGTGGTGGTADAQWGDGVVEGECKLGEARSCGEPPSPDDPWGAQSHEYCSIGADNTTVWGQCCEHPFEDPCACDPNPQCYTPLVLVFDDQPVEMAAGGAGDFDLSGAGLCVATDWPTAATPWLALDRSGDGAIGGGDELFGSATRLRDGRLATNGFEALRELDSDGDGRISPADARWSSLVLWRDTNSDRASAPRELTSLTSGKIRWIELAYRVTPRCDARGNCERERARFGYTDATGRDREGAIVDLHLRVQAR